MGENEQRCWLYNNCNHKDCGAVFCVRKYKLDSLYKNSLLSDAQRARITLRIDEDKTDFDAFTRLSEIEKTIDDFVKNGKNLYIHSQNCGNGKTSWAVRLVQAYFNKIWPKSGLGCHALFISVPRFLTALKDSISRKSDYIDFIKDNIMEADLVVFDDVATKPGTEYEINQLLSIIDGRTALGKSNIYTSNKNTAEIYTELGERIASRICNLSEEITLFGADKRCLAVGGNRND